MVCILKVEISTTLPFNLANHFCTVILNLEDNSSGKNTTLKQLAVYSGASLAS